MGLSLPVTLGEAIRWLEILFGASLLVQCVEFLRLENYVARDGLWSWGVQRREFTGALRILRPALDLLFRDGAWHLHLVLRVALATSMLAYGSSLAVSALLFAGTVLILLRWRGAFNGGSDFMTLVVATGMFIGHLASLWVAPEIAWKAGLWYVTIHVTSSYFVSGAVKLFHAEWREGRALPFFLDGGVFGPLAPDSPFRVRRIAALASWGFILWEISFPLALAGPLVALHMCAIAFCFHLLVFWFFGLNRFVLAWTASFPAVIFCSTQVGFFG